MSEKEGQQLLCAKRPRYQLPMAPRDRWRGCVTLSIELRKRHSAFISAVMKKTGAGSGSDMPPSLQRPRSSACTQTDSTALSPFNWGGKNTSDKSAVIRTPNKLMRHLWLTKPASPVFFKVNWLLKVDEKLSRQKLQTGPNWAYDAKITALINVLVSIMHSDMSELKTDTFMHRLQARKIGN